MFISIVITVKNEAENIADLLDSLVVQEDPFEVLIIDANSNDETQAIIREYEKKYKEIKLIVHEGTRGESRNFGVENAKGEIVAFIDGDCIANPFWLKEIRKKINEGYDVVAGKTVNLGYKHFKDLQRVELEYKGYDTTFPSCNLAYVKRLFKEIGGFDDRFITGEDIDLNLRAIDAGAKIGYNEKAIVYHRIRSTFRDFVKQAFWNGYGRKQLTLKHGNLWRQYSPKKMFQTQFTFWGLMRLLFGLLGYTACKISGGGFKN